MAKVQIIHCYREDEHTIDHLVFNSTHSTVDPPEGEKHEKGTVWVMGALGEPVKLYSNEFNRVYR